MSEPQWRPFSIADGVPAGTTVLEASAGTGKTWTIAALVARHIAVGRPLSDLLLVTFGRSASVELRERVRGQLDEAHRWLGGTPGTGALHDLITAGSADQRARRRRDFATALAGFDTATIATTHTFCSRMLAGLGIAGDHDPRAQLDDDLGDLAQQVIGDTYLRRYAGGGGVRRRPPISFTEAAEVASVVLANPGSRIEPSGEPPTSSEGQRVAFARDVVATMDHRKRLTAVLSYDDLQVRLRDALHDPARGAHAVALLQRRFPVVMVDEFQDTDPVQWDILRTAFSGASQLVLIGDPKQAIYAFRGGDVVTYLRAIDDADQHLTLHQNWRSDEHLVTGLGTLFGDLPLGDQRIVVRPVTAARVGGRLHGAGAPVRIRHLTRPALGIIDPGQAKNAVSEPIVFADLAADVARLLTGGARLKSEPGITRPLQPGDIAVLVDRNSWSGPIRAALADVGVPAVDSATASVFDTEAAVHWLTLLRALESPHRPALTRAALLTPFVGWSAQRLASAVTDDDAVVGALDLDLATTRLIEWSTLLTTRGVTAAYETLSVSTDLDARVLAQPAGERLLTDLRHIAELLHAVARDQQLGLPGLIDWLRLRVEDAGGDQNVERARRLASDARAVQIITVHRAKGLEYPVVYVPGAAYRSGGGPRSEADPGTRSDRTWEPLLLHDADGHRVIDVSTAPAGRDITEANAEAAGEDLRKLYVALTRASSQVVTWWVPGTTTPFSALHRILFAERDLSGQLAGKVRIQPDSVVADRLNALAGGCDGAIAIEQVTGPPRPVHVPPVEPSGQLAARAFTRDLDTAWRRTSYSGLTAAAHADVRTVVAASEPDEYTLTDEPQPADDDEPPEPTGPAAGAPADPAQALARERVSPMGQLPGGAAFGTVVHEVLEGIDLDATSLSEELLARCGHVLARRGSSGLTATALREALLPALQTPMVGLPGNPALADLADADVLREADFELPLAGGDLDDRAGPVLADLADLLRVHLPPDDLLAGYPDRLREPNLPDGELRGYLTGSIDAVLRLTDGAEPRYVVVDYKTNRLSDDTLTAWHYRPDAMAQAMMDSHYPLQALLYTVALHRFLRWRQPGYDPGRHLGGAAYLFLRGMCGPDTPVLDGQTCGVFRWQPSAALVVATSDLLAGRQP